MNCRPHSLVYVAKLVPWSSRLGESGTIDIRGTVFRISTIAPGHASMWLVYGAPLRAAVFSHKPSPRGFSLQIEGVQDEYLRPFGDPMFREIVQLRQELTR